MMSKYMGIWPKGPREPGQPGDPKGANAIKKAPVGLGRVRVFSLTLSQTITLNLNETLITGVRIPQVGSSCFQDCAGGCSACRLSAN
ncbi:MAG: hypothetical protein CM1200mP41_38460 [Gammaproteobacteria bacterium]|nr:MAG: hypothetical protein CM1200mP41_38460 [Gammaproteobacteria bacterium]